jgi:SAM-dependent methyltransferase
MRQDETSKQTEAEEFWDDFYQKSSSTPGHEPGAVLKRIALKLAPGRALDLGCAKGDDAVWLARQSWTVTAVDVSTIAVGYARENALHAGVEDGISFEQHDLSRSFPDGAFDLIYASFLYSPTPLVRAEIFRRAANSVVSGGHLLIIDHGSRAPWSWTAEGTQYPTADEAYQALSLDPNTWQPTQVEDVERLANGPEGQQAKVIDTVLLLTKL